MNGRLRELPPMQRFLRDETIARFEPSLGIGIVKATIDDVLRAARASALERDLAPPPSEVLVADIVTRLADLELAGLIEVINGTGIVLHTNLGRAPLSVAATDAMTEVGGGYSNIEFDLTHGVRGSRYERVSALLRTTTGAEDALVVNNCAAAVLLVLDTFARTTPGAAPREVIVSRNQLVEIGGGFRLPDVLARSGAKLVEVGTTNKVYLRDFERALTVETALLMRSHTSNYRIEGFVADVDPTAFAALGKRVGVATVEDLGSGVLIDLTSYGLPRERTVREAVADGIDLVIFSGDKLLGGPQAGIVVGRASAIARMRANPLLRALRVDKSTLAALAATLRCYLKPEGHQVLPLYAMLGASVDSLRARVDRLLAHLGAVDSLELLGTATTGYVGGGTAPTATLPSYGIAVRSRRLGANELARRLRQAPPHLVARVEDDAVIVDFRTIPASREADVAAAIRNIA